MIGWRARVHQQCDFALSLTCRTKRGNSGTRRSPAADRTPVWFPTLVAALAGPGGTRVTTIVINHVPAAGIQGEPSH
jgi:hypothetical protein